jgi:hypothetical protein
MLRGINGNPYLDLEKYIDVKSFDDIQTDIHKGFALSKHLAVSGCLEVPTDMFNENSHELDWKPLSKAYNEFLQLSDTDPIKIAGQQIMQEQGHNQFVTYLKYALGAYDLYTFYVLWDFKEGWREDSSLRELTDVSMYFSSLVDWIDNLKDAGIFSHIGRASFFVLEAGGVSFEHRDPAVDPEFPEVTSEFIHIRPDTDRPFYVRDPDTLEKTYIKTRVGYWNDQDWHGGEQIMKPTYGLRIDGVFTEEFRNIIL